jgi:hypothetical protein
MNQTGCDRTIVNSVMSAEQSGHSESMDDMSHGQSELSHLDNPSEENMIESVKETIEEHSCDNCLRSDKYTQGIESLPDLEFTLVLHKEINRWLKWCLILERQDSYLLCGECLTYFEIKKPKGWKPSGDIIWNCFISKLLRNYHTLHGVFMWSLILQEWRYWWFPYIEKQASLSSVITMDDPKPRIKDVTYLMK